MRSYIGWGGERNASKEVDTRRCASKEAGPQRGWIVRSHIGWGGEQNIFYKGVETSSRVLKP